MQYLGVSQWRIHVDIDVIGPLFNGETNSEIGYPYSKWR